jgi:hypothetical protein
LRGYWCGRRMEEKQQSQQATEANVHGPPLLLPKRRWTPF